MGLVLSRILTLLICSGFTGFGIRYSEMMENVSVTFSAKSGTVLLSSMLMQFWQPMWSGLSVRNGNENMKDLIIEGSIDVINYPSVNPISWVLI